MIEAMKNTLKGGALVVVTLLVVASLIVVWLGPAVLVITTGSTWYLGFYIPHILWVFYLIGRWMR